MLLWRRSGACFAGGSLPLRPVLDAHDLHGLFRYAVADQIRAHDDQLTHRAIDCAAPVWVGRQALGHVFQGGGQPLGGKRRLLFDVSSYGVEVAARTLGPLKSRASELGHARILSSRRAGQGIVSVVFGLRFTPRPEPRLHVLVADDPARVEIGERLRVSGLVVHVALIEDRLQLSLAPT